MKSKKQQDKPKPEAGKSYPVPGFPMAYISPEGMITIVKKSVSYPLKTYQKKSGIPYCYLQRKRGEKAITWTIPELLAITFIDNPEGLPHVEIIDKNRPCTDIKNLRWTRKVPRYVTQYKKQQALKAAAQEKREAAELANDKNLSDEIKNLLELE